MARFGGTSSKATASSAHASTPISPSPGPASLRTTPKNLENTAHTSVTISFTNKTSEDVTDAVIFLYDEEIHRADLVAPGMTWGKTYPRDRLGLEQLPKEPAPAAGEVLNRQLRPRLVRRAGSAYAATPEPSSRGASSTSLTS